MNLIKGQTVRIRHAMAHDDWCWATVAVASQVAASGGHSSRQSVGLLLEGVVRSGAGFITGALPLFVDYETERVTSLFGEEYEIEVAEAA